MTRNVLLVIIIVLLLWNAVILCDIRLASYEPSLIQRDKGSEPPRKPGKLIPNPALPQWNL